MPKETLINTRDKMKKETFEMIELATKMKLYDDLTNVTLETYKLNRQSGYNIIVKNNNIIEYRVVLDFMGDIYKLYKCQQDTEYLNNQFKKLPWNMTWSQPLADCNSYRKGSECQGHFDPLAAINLSHNKQYDDAVLINGEKKTPIRIIHGNRKINTDYPLCPLFNPTQVTDENLDEYLPVPLFDTLDNRYHAILLHRTGISNSLCTALIDTQTGKLYIARKYDNVPLRKIYARTRDDGNIIEYYIDYNIPKQKLLFEKKLTEETYIIPELSNWDKTNTWKEIDFRTDIVALYKNVIEKNPIEDNDSDDDSDIFDDGVKYYDDNFIYDNIRNITKNDKKRRNSV